MALYYQELMRQLSPVYAPREALALIRWFMDERYGLSDVDLLLGKDSTLSANDRIEIQNIINRLLKNEPLQYILGSSSFGDLRLKVAPGVLIPRPETVELVDWIIRSRTGLGGNDGPPGLDIGTGSGCIALALAHRGFRMEAWDVSDEALSIARENAAACCLSVNFSRQDILQLVQSIADGSVPIPAPRYGFIVSNPPYVCQRERSAMERNVLDYEPHLALFVPDDDPLLFYRAIARFAVHALVPGGELYFEINRAYPDEMRELLLSMGFSQVEVRNDQFDNPRMVRARWCG